MLFNSMVFLVFLFLFFVGYWFVFNRWLKLQNLFILVTSYIFYGWWDWRFLFLIAFTSGWVYCSGLFDLKDASDFGRKFRLILSCVVNLGILFVFKYYNFFYAEIVSWMQALNIHVNPSSFKIILPVGISFYTFQSLSYTIDIYKGVIKPVRDPIAFFAYVSFFPQLVAGPIERATHLLPQFMVRKTFDYGQAVLGVQQMLWGFFKKMVVADNCAGVVDFIFKMNGDGRGGLAIWVAMLCFTFQIYCDFSGYSDIGIGCAKLFGFRLSKNFAVPYFSRDISEFWRRWHISLTTWFRDYVYIPLGGSRCSQRKCIINTCIVFLVSGIWHGANWTYLFWGAFHALLFMPLIVTGRNRKNLDCVAAGRTWPSAVELVQMGGTFLLVVLTWTLFRAPDISTAFIWLQKMLTFAGGLTPEGTSGAGLLLPVLPWMILMVLVEWISRNHDFGCAVYPQNRFLRWCIYVGLYTIIFFFSGNAQTFIYFQF